MTVFQLKNKDRFKTHSGVVFEMIQKPAPNGKKRLVIIREGFPGKEYELTEFENIKIKKI